MIKKLIWDSSFFKRKIGELIITSIEPAYIKSAINKAKKDGFKYIICKIKSQDTLLIKQLESLGFYLSDIGIILSNETDKFLNKYTVRNSIIRKSINVATYKDIPMLKKIIKSLFLESRFYSDSFFSKEEADELYQTWIKNSVLGHASDVVFCIPHTGFVTCKKSKKKSGEIALIGIKKEFRGKGFGRILLEKAMKWFMFKDIKLVTVRTQLKNIDGINFYLKSGFSIKEYDIIFSKIL